MSLFRRFWPRRGQAWSEDRLTKLFSGYVGDDRVDRIAAQLTPIGERVLSAPPRILSILFAARAGSTYAAHLLSNTVWFSDVNESFQPEQLSAIRERHDLADSRAAVQWMIDNRGTEQAFGYKGGFSVLIAANLTGFLPETLARTQFVRLERRDRVAQAVSLLKADIGGRLHSVNPDGRTVSVDEYDADKIAFNVGHVARNERWFQEITERLGRPAPVFFYEDICADPAKFVADIGALMGFSTPAGFEPEVDLQVMRDEVSQAWIDRFRAERPDIR